MFIMFKTIILPWGTDKPRRFGTFEGYVNEGSQGEILPLSQPYVEQHHEYLSAFMRYFWKVAVYHALPICVTVFIAPTGT